MSVRAAADTRAPSNDVAASEVPSSALPDSTSMGTLELNVSDLETMRSYYEAAVGLQVLHESEDTVELGLDVPLIKLQAVTDAEATATSTEAGLYHSAILYPDEATLARTILRIATVTPYSFQGSADHLVSLAFYFVDPEGNGLELYVDRPSDEWVWKNGQVEMGSYKLDPNAFISEHLGTDLSIDLGLDATATMGHVHMKVGDLDIAERFYADALGFAVTSRGNGAIFYSAGGYHHHLATNTWQSAGATERTNATGLGSLTITVDDATELDVIAKRLDAHGVSYEASNVMLDLSDPWGNRVRIVAAKPESTS